MKRSAVQRLTIIAFLVALEIVLARFCSISTPIVRIGFNFLPISMIAMLYGPLPAAAGYAIADFIGAILFPVGAYFPGFTLTAFLAGLLYGLVLYKKPVTWGRTILAASAVSMLQLGLDTYWLTIFTGQGIFALLPARFVKSLLMIPVITVGIQLLSARLLSTARKYVRRCDSST